MAGTHFYDRVLKMSDEEVAFKIPPSLRNLVARARARQTEHTAMAVGLKKDDVNTCGDKDPGSTETDESDPALLSDYRSETMLEMSTLSDGMNRKITANEIELMKRNGLEIWVEMSDQLAHITSNDDAQERERARNFFMQTCAAYRTEEAIKRDILEVQFLESLRRFPSPHMKTGIAFEPLFPVPQFHVSMAAAHKNWGIPCDTDGRIALYLGVPKDNVKAVAQLCKAGQLYPNTPDEKGKRPVPAIETGNAHFQAPHLSVGLHESLSWFPSPHMETGNAFEPLFPFPVPSFRIPFHVSMAAAHKNRGTACDIDGRTALHLAVLKDNVKAVYQLCKAGQLYPNIKDMHGRTALDYAKDRNQTSIEMELMNREDVKVDEDGLYKERQVYVDKLNATLLLSSALTTLTIGGTFGALLISASDSGIYSMLRKHPAMRIFAILSFVFSIVASVTSVMGYNPKRHIGATVTYVRRISQVAVMMLLISGVCFLIAITLAGLVML